MKSKTKPNYRYKLDPNTHKEITTLSQQMPKIPLMDSQGSMTFTIKPERLTGAQILERGLAGPSDKIDPGANYNYRHRIPNYMNHEVRLIEQYRLHGTVGVEDYKKAINDLYEAMKEARAAMKRQKPISVKVPEDAKVDEVKNDLAEDTKATDVAAEAISDVKPEEPVKVTNEVADNLLADETPVVESIANPITDVDTQQESAG